MKKLAEYIGHELKWVQPHASKMEYELRAGDTIVANLGFRSSFGSFATASSADGTWTFKRVGFFQTKATIRANDSETDLAVFINNPSCYQRKLRLAAKTNRPTFSSKPLAVTE